MKRISTLMVSACLLALTQNVVAQSVTMSTSNPNPNPTFKSALAVDSTFGFQSTNTTIFNDFPKGQTTAVTSPDYFYNTDQTTIYFKYSFTVANNVTIPATVSIITSATKKATSVTPSINFVKGTNDIYFAFTPGTSFPAGTNFRIRLELTVSMNDKAVTANSLTTNALQSSEASTLPVKFASFEAKPLYDAVALSWKVGTEDNVKGYEVERSADQKNFTRIGYVPAASQQTYTYTDVHPLSIAYYRIKSVDIDGRPGYSAIISLKSGKSSVVLKAFPTPVRSELTIQHGTAAAGSRIAISSVDGRLIQSIAPLTGSQQTVVDLSTAKAGLYLVRFENSNGETETLKVMKQ